VVLERAPAHPNTEYHKGSWSELDVTQDSVRDGEVVHEAPQTLSFHSDLNPKPLSFHSDLNP